MAQIQLPSTPLTRGTILVLGATGKTGRRIVDHLHVQGYTVRIGSRQTTPAFDWEHPEQWPALLENVEAVYINFAPDLAIPGATDAINTFVELAIAAKVKRAVLLSGRGEAEAQRCEALIQRPEWEWTVVRASWFAQNFSEGAFTDMVQAGVITLPVDTVKEPFVDVEDIAEVAVAALTQTGHDQKIYEVTGPELLTFAQAIEQIAQASGRSLVFQPIPLNAFLAAAKEQGTPKGITWLMEYLFTTVLDGRNAYLTQGVQQALGRAPRSFADFATRAAASGIWNKTEGATS